MPEFDKQQIEEMIECLAAWPADGRPQNVMLRTALQALGFIEEKTQMKSCKSCGTPRPDWTYYKITPAGKILLAVAAQRNGK
jgi:hypothetical protein